MSKFSRALGGINALEDHAQKDTIVHKLHPMVKLIITFLYVFIVISFPKNSLGVIFFFFYPFIMIPLSEIPIKLMISRIVIVLPFSIFASIWSIFLDRDVVLTFLSLEITSGFITFLAITLKTVLTVLCVFIFIGTTRLSQICYSLQTLKIPKVFIVQMMLLYQYIGILIEQTQRMFIAYSVRSNMQKGIALKHAGSFLGMLLLSTYDKGRRIYYAMECRGFHGDFPLPSQPSFKFSDLLLIIMAGLLCVGLRILFA